MKDGSRNGCFEVNAALELGSHDEEIAGEIANAFLGMEVFLRDAIERGYECGEISQSVDPIKTSRSLLALFLGIRVLARVRPEKSLLCSIVAQVDTLLG